MSANSLLSEGKLAGLGYRARADAPGHAIADAAGAVEGVSITRDLQVRVVAVGVPRFEFWANMGKGL